MVKEISKNQSWKIGKLTESIKKEIEGDNVNTTMVRKLTDKINDILSDIDKGKLEKFYE
jgi:hypothetical protein